MWEDEPAVHKSLQKQQHQQKKRRIIQLIDKPTIFIMMVIIIDRFDIALLSALEQTHCGLVACDSAD